MAGRVPAHPSSRSLLQGQLTSPPRGLFKNFPQFFSQTDIFLTATCWVPGTCLPGQEASVFVFLPSSLLACLLKDGHPGAFSTDSPFSSPRSLTRIHQRILGCLSLSRQISAEIYLQGASQVAQW